MIDLAREVPMLLVFLLVSYLGCKIIVKSKPLHRKFSLDNLDGPQRIHCGEVPRIGGFVIFIVLAIFLFFTHKNEFYNYIFLCSLPVFLAGLFEDFLKNVSIKTRLLCSVFSGLLLIFFVGLQLDYSGVFLIDKYLTHPYFWLTLTIISIAALVNAVNFIDGLNGLASGSTIIMAASLLYLGIENSLDEFSLFLGGFIAIYCGFFLVNFPNGRIFLGDGGAYLGGFILASAAIVLVKKSTNILPFLLLVVFAYPIVEVLFSIIRKTIMRGKRAYDADELHLHMLLYRFVKKNYSFENTEANAISSMLMLLFPLSGLTCISLFRFNEIHITFYFIIFVMVYFFLYRKLYLELKVG